MKKLNLFGLLVVFACTFQACHSPEVRAAQDDSLAKDSKKTDTVGGKMAAGTKTDTSNKDTSKITGMKPVVTSNNTSPKKTGN